MKAIKKFLSTALALVLLVLVAEFVIAPALVVEGISPKSAFTKWVLIKVNRVLGLLEAVLDYLKGK